MKDELKEQRAAEAYSLLQNPLINKALDEMKDHVVNKLEIGGPLTDLRTQDLALSLLYSIKAFKDALFEHIETGKLEKLKEKLNA